MQTSKFDTLNEEILAEARKVFSETVIDHAMNPRNVGELPDADGYGTAVGHCSDSIEIWLKVKNDQVVKAQFWTDGCASTIASGSMATEVLKGKYVFQVLGLTQKDILDAIDGLPADQEHCATLAANAVRMAAKDYLATKGQPWKRTYHCR